MKSRITSTALIVGLFALLGYFAYCEVIYSQSKAPTGIATINDFYDRFRKSSRAYVVIVDDREYLCLSGPLPSKWPLALPSSPPVYVFDKQGMFVDWCSDPGDNFEWSQKWLNDLSPPLNDSEVHHRVGAWKDANHE